MEETTQTFWQKYAWLFAVACAVIAILVLFLPILNYEIREAIYDTVTGERISKTDYVYNVNLITYFTSSFKLNYTMYITLGLIAVGAILAGTSNIKKELLAASGIFFLLAMCMIILSKEFFKSDESCLCLHNGE